MYELFNNVANNEFKDKLYVVDSYAVSTIMLSHVMFAKDQIEKGVEIEELRNLRTGIFNRLNEILD
jgi:hypothetical protein